MILNIPLVASGASELTDNAGLQLTTLRQAPKTTGRNGWRVVEEEVLWQPSETAIIIVDMWNKHWSWGATERVDIMAPRMNAVHQYRQRSRDTDCFTHRQIRWISTTDTPRGLGSLMSRI